MGADELISRATALLNEGQFGAANDLFGQLITAEPRNSRAHYWKAVCLQQLGKYQDAIAGLNIAIDIDAHHAAAFNLLGACYLFEKSAVVAELCFRRAIELQPAYADAWNNLGLLLVNKRRMEEASAVLSRAVELSPSDINAICNMARVHVEMDRPGLALSLYRRACVLQPSNTNAILGMVGSLQKSSRYQEALTIVKRIPRDDPVNGVDALRAEAVLLSMVGMLDESCQVYDQALAAAPAYLELTSARAAMRKVTADEPFFHHLKALEPMVEAATGSPKTHLCYALGKAYQDIGDIGRAAHYFASGGESKRQEIDYDEASDIELFAQIKKHFTVDHLRDLAVNGSPSRRPIFVLGMERSGTTLIEQILASHPAVFAGGELTYVAEVLDGLVMPGVGKFVADGSSVDSDATLRERAERYLEKLNTLPGSAGHLYVVDKMPDNFKLVGLIQAMFPHAAIIHCRRDPVDNCISSYTTLFRGGIPWSFDLSTMGRRYREYWDLMAHWRTELPGRFLELRYEQVVDDTEAAAKSLLQWCNLDWDPRVLDFHKTKRPVLTASVTQVRQPIYRTSIGRWKKWEPYIQPLLAEIGDIGRQYWAELDARGEALDAN